MMTNHDDEMGCEDSRRGCDDGYDKAVEEAKKITWGFHLHFCCCLFWNTYSDQTTHNIITTSKVDDDISPGKGQGYENYHKQG